MCGARIPVRSLGRCQNARGDNRNGRHKLRGKQKMEGRKRTSSLAAEETCTSLSAPWASASGHRIRAAGGRPPVASGPTLSQRRSGGGLNEIGRQRRRHMGLCIGFATQECLTLDLHLKGGIMRRNVAHSIKFLCRTLNMKFWKFLSFLSHP